MYQKYLKISVKVGYAPPNLKMSWSPRAEEVLNNNQEGRRSGSCHIRGGLYMVCHTDSTALLVWVQRFTKVLYKAAERPSIKRIDLAMISGHTVDVVGYITHRSSLIISLATASNFSIRKLLHIFLSSTTSGLRKFYIIATGVELEIIVEIESLESSIG